MIDEETGGEAAVDLDSLIAACGSALDHFGGEIGAEDVDFPPGQQREVLAEQHGDGIGFLAAGRGGRPEPEGARVAAAGNEGGQELLAKQVKSGKVAKEAGFVDGHGFCDGALQAGSGFGAQGRDELVEGVETAVAEKALEARLEQVIAGRIDVIAGIAHDHGAQVLEIDGG